MSAGGHRTALDPQKRFRLESAALLVLACLFIFFSHRAAWFAPLDRVVYDTVIANVPGSLHDNVVLVGIDDASLNRYGPWPWPRALQAELISRAEAFAPDTLVVDIIYAGNTTDDRALVEAAANVGRLALPVMVDSLGQGQQHIEVLPFPALLDHADALGHVHVELDDDAIVRGTYLYQGVGTPRWPHLMAALATEPANPAAHTCMQQQPSTLFMAKCAYVGIPFAGAPGTYPEVAAHMLLANDPGNTALLASAITGKTVLIGLTAAGAGDWVTSPTSGDSGPMSGVEFNANLLSALTHGETIHPAPSWLLVLIGMAFVGLCSMLLPRLKPKQMLMTSLALGISPAVVTAGMLAGSWTYLPLANATIAVILIYPLWSWRRHEIAWQFIAGELNRIDAESRDWLTTGATLKEHSDRYAMLTQLGQMLGGELKLQQNANTGVEIECERPTPPNPAESTLLQEAAKQFFAPDTVQPGLPGEVLAAQIRRLELRAREVREGRAIGLAGLGRMSNGVLIVSAFAQIMYMNKAAHSMLDGDDPHAGTLLEMLEQIQPPLGQSWADIMRRVVLDQAPVYFEGHTPKQSPVFIAAEPLSAPASSPFAPFWVLTLSDLSAIRTAEAQREEALAFLSHDIRSPLLSVLALIRGSGERSQLLDDISRYTQKGLSTSEQFLQLSRLQLQTGFERYELELEQVIHNAVEQVFFLARDKSIRFNLIGALAADRDLDEEGIWLSGNGELLERALVNLLGNAIKYSDPDTDVTIDLNTEDNVAVVRIEDQGHGIPKGELEHIFEPYFRSAEPELAENRGAGLGLRFVKTVVERHEGSIAVASKRGEGSVFTLRLPCNPAPG